jgi:hypothetical protein
MSGTSAGAKKGWSGRVRGRIAGISKALRTPGVAKHLPAMVAWETHDLNAREAKLVRRIFRSRAR